MLWADSNPVDGILLIGVEQGLFSFEGNKWSISIMGGNNWSFSTDWKFPTEETGGEDELDVAAKCLRANYNIENLKGNLYILISVE